MKFQPQSRILVSISDKLFIFISLILFQVFVGVLGKEDSPLKLTCSPKKLETVFPAIRHIGDLNSTIQQSNNGLLVQLRWRRMKLEIVLHPNDVTIPQTHSEWTWDNITYAKFPKRSCLYSGYVKGHSSSHVALSLCSGVSGYIQTDIELLFVQPKSTNSRIVGPTAHIMYTCEPKSRPSNLETFTKYSHERRRRSTQKSKYLQVALVVDNNIVEEVGNKDKTVEYIMALMNIVNTVYQHHSLGVDIKVVVIKLIFLNKSQQKEVVDKRDALRTVNMFCDWSSKQIRPMDYDVSVLITEADFGPAGYAPLSTLCQPTRSCAAVRDEGFLTAFVIAHEIAHVFGLYHDGHGNHCYGRKYESAMMATQVMSKLNHFWWSECSSNKMKDVIRYLPCLNNEPKPISNHYPLKPDNKIDSQIGKPWSLDFQCRMEFGYNFRFCTSVGDSPCSVLWCSNASYPYHCRTKRGPPLPGTSCGHDKECRNEVCKYVGNRKPVNGKWSSWSQWTPCSTDCGVGLKHRTRACNNPEPEFGGTPCEGEISEWDTCLNTKCDTYEDGKQKDCDNWDHIQIRYGTHKWQAFEGQNDSSLCLQTCKSFYTDEVVTLDVLVENGTPCSYTRNVSNICMNGICITVGCDGKMNSTMTEDQCGVCGGNGSQCKVISGHFSQKPRSGEEYMTIITLPVNARQVKIINNKQSSHFLALQDPRYGTFYLNGDKRQSKDKMFVMNGAMFEYLKGSTKNNETISTNGPVRRKIQVMMYPNKFMNETDIFYSYVIHKTDNSYEINKYAWKFDKWSDCSVTCGAGKHTMLHICYDKDNGQRVDDDKCSLLKAPRRDEVSCQRGPCSAVPNHSYNYGMENTYEECNATCGQLGVQVQKFHCEKHFANNNTYVEVPQKFCEHLSKPYQTISCQGKPCQSMERFQWASSNWSKCYCDSESSKGFQWQEIWCEQVTVNGSKETLEKTDLTKCQTLTDKPKENNACPLTSCIPQLRWNTGPNFGPCNAECGETGEEKNIMVCEFENKNGTVDIVDISRCENIIKPTPASRSCTIEPCKIEPKLFTWMPLNDWSDCDAACNQNGTHLRHYVCQEIISNTHQINVSSSLCDLNTRPDERKECQGLPCTLKWQLGEWSACSVTCGKGKNYRKVFCGDPVSDHDDNRCLDTPPPMSKICNMKECPEQSDEDCVNMHSYCSAYKDLNTRCKRDNFKRKCCRVCLDYEKSANRHLSPLQLLIKRRGLQKVKRISS